MKPLVLYGRNGFGDAIYTRAMVQAVRRTRPVRVETAWPELFSDLGIPLVRASTPLWGPTRNMARAQIGWAQREKGAERRSIRYAWGRLARNGLLGEMERLAGVRISPFDLNLPPLPASPMRHTRLAIVRPVSVRRDWPNPARNPDPRYLHQAAQQLIDLGFLVVSVAHLASGIEDAVGEPVPAHQRFEQGELRPLELLALVRAATIVVGGPGWIVPAALAARTPFVMIGGGRGGCDAPHILIDPRMHQLAGFPGWILPDAYCHCTDKHHACSKAISDFERRFRMLVNAGVARKVA